MTQTLQPTEPTARLSFDVRPQEFIHWRLSVDGDTARLLMAVQEDRGLKSDYVLKLNSYDLGVDIELAAAIQHLRFAHPEVRCLVLSGALERVFCSGANIMMLRQSTHAFKVNFCKFTNETRLYLEDASAHSGLRTLAALNGTASGGGYELALACDRILLVDDRSSAVSLPELPLLGVLPGTGGLTRVVDKRKVRRDRADVFNTVAEGIKGKRAVEWNLVDAIAPLSRFEEVAAQTAHQMAAQSSAVPAGQGVNLPRVTPKFGRDSLEYQHVRVALDRSARVAQVTLTVPAAGPGGGVGGGPAASAAEGAAAAPTTAAEAHKLGGAWWPLAMFRELDDALLHLRLEELDTGTITLHTRGNAQDVLAADALLHAAGAARAADPAAADAPAGGAGAPPGDVAHAWFVRETRLLIARVLRRLDLSSRSIFAVVDAESCFVGTLLELALAADRTYVLNDSSAPVSMGVSAQNGGAYPMSNGITRLATRFLGTPSRVGEILAEPGLFDAERADELGLATAAPDAIDWEDELRLALEERAAFSPDALTGLEANLRFAGPETMETKIFGRLSAWQNWIFQRPNAIGERGALKCYGTPNRPEFDWKRT